jgi:hypothetical protein
MAKRGKQKGQVIIEYLLGTLTMLVFYVWSEPVVQALGTYLDNFLKVLASP